MGIPINVSLLGFHLFELIEWSIHVMTFKNTVALVFANLRDPRKKEIY